MMDSKDAEIDRLKSKVESLEAANRQWRDYAWGHVQTMPEAPPEARLRSQGGEAGASQGPKPLAWTREKPTEGGYYFLREKRPYKAEVDTVLVRISSDGAERVAWFNGRHEYLGNIRQDCEWAGPLPEPASQGSETPQASPSVPARGSNIENSSKGGDRG